MIHKSLLLTGLAIAPTLSSVPLQTYNATTIQEQEINIDEEQAEPESCTFMYVGKKVSANGMALVARCGDSIPRGMNLNATIFQHNQLANVVTKGKNGFEWKMPATTYKYISTPRNPIVKNGLHWEVSAVNEKGVAVSATLSCNSHTPTETYKDTILTRDPLVTTGITEDNIAQIVGATASTAREGIETIAKIIDEQGSGESNAIMVMDKNEVWYMEMYTGHHYVAIKMPDDKACTIGNEFMLDSLGELNLQPNDYIVSKNILTKFEGLYQFKSATQTIENLNLYATFAGGKGAQGSFANNCHMRTWRGRNLFAKEQEEYIIDSTSKLPTKKYDAFWTPKRNLSVSDVIKFMRDRYENLLDSSSTDPSHQAFVEVLEKEKSLRSPSSNTTYQVHVMYVDPELPTEISAQEWVAFSSASYTPFVPINAGITSMDQHYTYVIPNYGWDENAACCIYKRLYAITDLNRKNYGIPIESYITLHEDIWQQHYAELISQIKSQSIDVQKNVLTNYCSQTQLAGIYTSQTLFDDLAWFIGNAGAEDIFKPFISLEYYGWLYGWSYEFKDNIATLKNGDNEIKLNCDYKDKPAFGWIMGQLTVDGVSQGSVRAKVSNGVAYMDHEAAKNWIAGNRALAPIKWQDYFTGNDRPSWVIPVAITVPIVVILAAIAPIAAIKSTKKKKGDVATHA